MNLLHTHKNGLNGMFFLLAVLILASGCRKEYPVIPAVEEGPLAISANHEEVVLSQKMKNANALAFEWTAGSNKGTGSAISYVLQLAEHGTAFSPYKEIALGKQAYNTTFRHGELNDILTVELGLPVGQPSLIEARIIADFQTDELSAVVSESIAVNVTPYVAVSETLFMLGPATPGGNDPQRATELTVNPVDETVFTLRGTLRAGDFYFITSREGGVAYQAGNESGSLEQVPVSEVGRNLTVEEDGVYLLSVDLAELTYTLQPLDAPAHTRLWVLGSAVPKGWDIDNPDEMLQDIDDPFIFHYHEVLAVGELKIPVATGDFGTDYYMPVNEVGDITDPQVIFVPGGQPDYKWQITEAGPYKITLNLREMTISIVKFTPYARLWIVGGATPNGWNIDNPNEMTVSPENPFEFIFEGPMTADEFKIPVSTGDWDADYFMPVHNHPPAGDRRAILVPNGNPDHKWLIPQAGNYRITLNQLKETISIEQQ